MTRWLIRLVGALPLALCLSTGAEAHRLKLFATVEDGVVEGYGFFIGGGRPGEAELIIRDGAGTELFRGPAAADGSFRFTPAVPADLALTMNAGDGHVADTRIAASRFPQAGGLAPAGAVQAAEGATSSVPADPAMPATGDDTGLAQLVDRSVDRAVSRQIEPLLEAYAQADGRARFNDVVSGIAMIIGLAGAALWASSRRRGKTPPTPPAGPS